MNKYLPIYLYGAIVIFQGVFLLFSSYCTFDMMNITTGLALTFGALFAFIAAFSRQGKQVQSAYHKMHALAMLVYGLSILLFCTTVERFISFTSYLFIFYTFSEIIFCNWLFNLRQKVIYKIILVRLSLGLVVGIGTILAMSLSTFELEGFGVLFIMVGINIMLYVPVMKG